MLKSAFSFNGRIRRSEYGFSLIIYNVYLIVVITLSGVPLIGESSQANGSIFSNIIFFLFFIPGVWFLIAQGAKRCHDLGNSGWFQVIPFYNLWMLFADSTYGTNKYGLNPKGVGNIDDLDSMRKTHY